MEITKQELSKYIESFYKPLNPFLADLRREAEAENIPIISRETEVFLGTLLALHRPKRILEIGTAVGYSALYFAMSCPQAQVTTLEIQEWLYKRACDNFSKTQFSKAQFSKTQGREIEILLGDARETLKDLKKEKDRSPSDFQAFDFVFIDGATNHYKEIWEGISGLCEPGTVIVADNVFYKGGTISDIYLDHPRNKTIARRMREYLDHVTALPGVQTSIMSIGDGIAVSLIE